MIVDDHVDSIPMVVVVPLRQHYPVSGSSRVIGQQLVEVGLGMVT